MGIAIAPTLPPPASSFWNPWGILILAAGALAAVGAAICYFNSSQPKTQKTGKRGVKPIKKEPPPPPAAAPPPPQPVVPLMQPIFVQPTIAQPLPMTQIQQPITTVAAQAVAQPFAPPAFAQPMAAYAGAPQFVQQRPM